MFYNNFIKMCNLRGKSPSAALTEAGIDKSAASRWRKGKKPTDATIRKLADYFRITPAELTGEFPARVTKKENLCDNTISAEALDVARAYEKADDRTRKMVKLALEPFGLSASSDKAM